MMVYIGVILNLLGALAAWLNLLEQNESLANIFLFILLASWLVSFIGIVVGVLGKKKAGGILVMVGSALFVPLGLIAIIGARTWMATSAEEGLHERRMAVGNTLRETNHGNS